MPSRNIYSLVPLDESKPERSLNVEDPQDQSIIRLLVQLCRIALRALEVLTLRNMQSRLNDVNRPSRSEAENVSLACEVAQLLGSLRWRLAWWQNVETPFSNLESTHRTTALTEILYFWYFAALRELSEESLATLPRSQISTYADIGKVEDEFPTIETHEGFRIWLLKAHQMIREAQIRGALPIYHDQPIDLNRP